MKRAIIHTDGSCCIPAGCSGGWAAIIEVDGWKKELSGKSAGGTTCNRMELTAAIEALRFLGEPHNVTVITDSQYLQNGASEWMYWWNRRGWTNTGGRRGIGNGKPLKNADLWKEIWRLCGIHNVVWKWVRGHDSCAENNRCDALAEKARMAI